MTFIEGIVLLIASVGVFFVMLSAIGILRLPDIYTRMHAAAKAATVGVSCVLLATGLYYEEYFLRLLFLIGLFFITGPIATTTMARAAYRTSNPEGKFVLHYDDMADRQ